LANSAEETPATDAGKSAAKEGGFFREWVVPIVLGLAIGGAAMWAWRQGGSGMVRPLFHSKAWNLVEKWQNARGDDADDSVVEEIQALGAGSRDDLLAVLRDLPADQMDAKVAVARLLAGEPWFATTSLKELIKDPRAAKCDRRAAACGLVDTQHKEVDTELVLPVFEEWMKDAADPDRGMAIFRIDTLWRQGMLNSQWEARVKRVLLDFAKRTPPAAGQDEDRVIEDRAAAMLVLELGVSDPEVRQALWTVVKDEADADLPRVNSIRALAQGQVLDAETIPDWTAASKAKDDNVRQAVADNLFRAKLPEFDKVLEPLQFDAKDLTRRGALDAQLKRRRPTMLERFDELIEDSNEFVRFDVMYANGSFKHETNGQAKRAAMMLRLVESSDDPVDVQGAVIALFMITDQAHGFKPTDVHLREQEVESTALTTFMADKAGRKDAADKWRAHFGAECTWTDAERAATLEKLLKSADPANVERAKTELAALKKR
jgi:hypothetical protein